MAAPINRRYPPAVGKGAGWGRELHARYSLRLAIDLGVSCDNALRDFPQPGKERPDLFGPILKISHGGDAKLSKQLAIWGIKTVLLCS
jgi:hypothetical protein